MSELSPEASRLFEMAREEYSPEEARAAKVGAALATQIALSASSGTAVAATKAAIGHGSGWVFAAKVLGAVLVLGAAGTAVTIASQRDAPVARSPRPTTSVSVLQAAPNAGTRGQAREPSAPVREVRAPALRVSETAAQKDVRDPVHVRGARPTVEAEKVVLEEDAAPEQRPSEQATTAELAQPDVAEPDVTRRSASPELARSNRQNRSDKKTPEPAVVAPPGTTAPTDSLASEIALVQRARAALDAGNPGQALGLLSQHAAQYPRGTLVEERIALRTLSLCALGRVREAALAERQLEATSPRSPYLERLRASCAAPAPKSN